MKKCIYNSVIFLVLIVFFSCNSNEKDVLKTGTWKGELSTSGGELPFFFGISKNENGNYSAEVMNGDEKINIDDVEIRNDSLILYLPAFNSKFSAEIENSSLKGTLTFVKANAVLQIIPFAAKQNVNYSFFQNPNTSIDVTGRWDVKFIPDDGLSYASVGEFIQNGTNLKGTFLTTTGDYRYLKGQVNDSTIYLSTFDGGHAFLFKATLNRKEQLNGGFWSGLSYHETWSAYRNENAKLPNPDSLTFLKKGIKNFDFSFPDLSRNIISLSDPKYKNKVVIVTLAGSWCPNCHDEARFLSPFYDKYQNEGVEIIGLMYENYTDTARAIEQIKKFKKKFNIKYDLLYAGINDKDFAGRTLPQLNRVLAFPTTIFIDKKGRVRKINTGFSGPGTGDYYIHLTDEFTDTVERLLNEN